MAAPDVSDPTDWQPTPLAGLAAVESALRCQMCKDFYKTPMLTSCSHTFCSLCIRRALAMDGQCPLCRTKAMESQLRNNWALDEAVVAFTEVRQATLEFAKRPPAPPPRRSPKRKVAASVEQSVEEPERKRLRSSTRLSSLRGHGPPASIPSSVPDVEPFSDEEDTGWHESVKRETVEDEQDAAYVPDDGLVGCPMCNKRMKEGLVFGHLDTCPGPAPSNHNNSAPRGQPSASTADNSRPPLGLPIPAPERLPTLNYDMMKEVALRKKMTDLGISSLGPRQLLQARHKEWITIWNANCDSARPKPRAALLQDLATWERTIGNASAGHSRYNRGVEVRDKEFDGDAWATAHQSSFRDLVASARRSRAPVQPIKRDPDAETEEESSAIDSPAESMLDLQHSPAGAPLPSIEGVADAPGVI
ncbi:hypothetical protein F5X68DRAFT_265396 [Plectosphaerella plurivora]|uniref:Postreplication repair E3 ubiquitin-protein ligase RAD18 n=1 Tax=Plectosphaerella plurivora TaxID=936078 RepID=A0A9P8V0H6_9PEZI|nr:hypothetical protein F5X68DRAFT_265396 [Plectosphaerella plurivora]